MRRILNTDLSERWTGRRGLHAWSFLVLVICDKKCFGASANKSVPLWSKYANNTCIELQQAIFRGMENIPLLKLNMKSLKIFRERITNLYRYMMSFSKNWLSTDIQRVHIIFVSLFKFIHTIKRTTVLFVSFFVLNKSVFTENPQSLLNNGVKDGISRE